MLPTMIKEEMEGFRQYQTTDDINHRVLFQEHGGEDNGESQAEGQRAHPSVSTANLALCNGQIDPGRDRDMNAGKHIGGSVCLIKHGGQLCKDILIGVKVGPKMYTVGINGTNEQREAHTKEQISSHPIKFLFGAAEQKENKYRSYIEKPE